MIKIKARNVASQLPLSHARCILQSARTTDYGSATDVYVCVRLYPMALPQTKIKPLLWSFCFSGIVWHNGHWFVLGPILCTRADIWNDTKLSNPRLPQSLQYGFIRLRWHSIVTPGSFYTTTSFKRDKYSQNRNLLHYCPPDDVKLVAPDHYVHMRNNQEDVSFQSRIIAIQDIVLFTIYTVCPTLLPAHATSLEAKT